MSERRVAIFWVSDEQFMRLVGAWSASGRFLRPACANLPAGAALEQVWHDFNRGSFAVLVRHPSFAPVPEGQPIPWLGRLEVEFQDTPTPGVFASIGRLGAEMARQREERVLAAITDERDSRCVVCGQHRDHQVHRDICPEGKREASPEPVADDPSACEVRLVRGDVTKLVRLPVPFKDQDGNHTGDVIAIRFDGEYTVGMVRLRKSPAGGEPEAAGVFELPADDPFTRFARKVEG